MSKKGKRANARKAIVARQKERQQQPQKNKGKKFLIFLKNTKTHVAFVIAVLSFLFVVYPRISILPGESLNPFRPFKTPFIIKNDGYLPLLDVDYSVKAETIKDANGNGFINVPTIGLSAKIPKLRSNTRSTVFIDQIFDMLPVLAAT
jgi:hypothetical protein